MVLRHGIALLLLYFWDICMTVYTCVVFGRISLSYSTETYVWPRQPQVNWYNTPSKYIVYQGICQQCGLLLRLLTFDCKTCVNNNSLVKPHTSVGHLNGEPHTLKLNHRDATPPRVLIIITMCLLYFKSFLVRRSFS